MTNMLKHKTVKNVYKMDDYEVELEKMAEAEEFVEVKDGGKELAKFRRAATNYFEAKPVNIRIPAGDLHSIKAKAYRYGMPYQSLIKSVLHGFAVGA